MENSTGLRPYQIEWYDKIFLPEYRGKTVEDSRLIKGHVVTEKIIAVTTEQLARRPRKFNRNITGKKILETYLEPLLNEGYIDRTGSDLDHRAYIYYPLIDAPKIFDYSIRGQSNNILQGPKIIVRNPTAYPSKQHIISKIEEVYRYSIADGLQTMIKNHSWQDMSVEDLVDQYYSNIENYFDTEYPSDSDSIPINRHYYAQLITKKHVFGTTNAIEYLKEGEVASESGKTSSKVFDRAEIEQSNTFSEFSHLLTEEHLANLNRTAYRCIEHPEIPYYDLKGIEESHFKLYHSNGKEG